VDNNYGTEPIATPPPAEAFKKSSLPLALVIMGATATILPIFVAFMILPQLGYLIEFLGAGAYGFLIFTPVILVVSFFIAMLLYGMHLMNLQKLQAGLNKTQHKLALIFLVCGIIAGAVSVPVLIMSIIQPIYAVINSFN
jgi:hypothetical protein